ncbi:hypothetical protein [Halostella sp. PRR32]|uniref:hypothetical protein n=1 Tax=Halostella sp. PRR32 TaxID=3098147 RepID=UPI002B1D2CF7|nr:hypothetical protein [Halostella sp. PRR32]
MDEWTRRDALRATAVGAVGAVAGCTAESAAFRADAPEYEDRDPDPYVRFMGSTDAPGRAAFYLAPSRVADALPSVAAPVADGLRQNTAWTGLPFEDIDHFVATGRSMFVVGNFRRSTARTALADAQGTPEAVNDGEFEVVYGTPMSPVLFSDRVIVSVPAVADAREDRPDERGIVHSRYGNWDGSVEELERDESLPPAVRSVAEAVGAPPVATVGSPLDSNPGLDPHRPTAPIGTPAATGVGWTVGERATAGRIVFDYPDGTPEVEAVEDRYGDGSGDRYVGGVEEFVDRTVRADDRTLSVQGEIATGQFDLLHHGNPVQPDATFVFEYGDGSVTVTHDGDERILGTNLTVTAGGRPLPGGFHETFDRRHVTEGDSVTVDVERATTVRVRWTASVDPNSEVTLGAFAVP